MIDLGAGRSRGTLITLGCALALVLGVLFVLVPISPFNMRFLHRDSGLFLYSGWRMLSGELPYRDLWDHKPPVIFAINYLGQLLTPGSSRGVWFIALSLLLLAATLGFMLLRRTLGLVPAAFSQVLWLPSLVFLIQGGNLTTEYALAMQFACLWLLYQSEKRGAFGWRGWLIGVLCGITFLPKQNATGIGLAIVLYILYSRVRQGQKRRLLGDLLPIAGGGRAVLGVVALFFALQGILGPMWDNAFRSNMVYIRSSNLERLNQGPHPPNQRPPSMVLSYVDLSPPKCAQRRTRL